MDDHGNIIIPLLKNVFSNLSSATGLISFSRSTTRPTTKGLLRNPKILQK